MSDTFARFRQDGDDPATHAVAVTPNDSVNLATATRGLYIGSAGNVKVDLVGSTAITFTALAVGVVHPFRVTRVYSTGTTAGSIVGVW